MEAEAMGIRTRSATRNAVRWMVLFLLLQYLGSHPSFAAAGEEEKHVTIGITRYFHYANSIFKTNFATRVDYTNSQVSCYNGGGLLASDQTPAAHISIAAQLRELASKEVETFRTYLGGTAEYTANSTPPEQRCLRGERRASLKCIYKWNEGAFIDSSSDGHGVSFFRGTMYTLIGAGPMNGYDAYWGPELPKHGQLFLMLRMDTDQSDKNATWYDGQGVPKYDKETPENTFGVVCETQEGYVVSTTTLPPTVEISWVHKRWYVILIAILVPVIVAVALITVCFCRCRGADDESKWVVHMVLREVSSEPLHPIDEDGGIYGDDSPMMRYSTLGDGVPMNTPSGYENVEVPRVIKNQETTVYDDGDVF
ncbi:hypothetical protein BCY84_03362 [Trypanosoma cruzi cruzi]|uniref:Uncharacterized protein n=2 Tax=Trypanosoma cruzi TaxID=5693 RepID=A0A2V2UMI8_TRYCR|nr:hypothetical protein BCY84_13680 [Trypanosoma cruzi cruzi]PBJ79112.1 hypothetical protein BCY84_03362 [Trypanosoma cruzi cruzi]PWU85264.1 hypothetical protein C4B63_170g5 [Trypanosoma cruzi]PWU90998.1 hypothetical protein C4B63_46g66 [Trypanosoma cruzi]